MPNLLVRNSNGKREVISILPDGAVFICYFEPQDCWFFAKPNDDILYRLDSSGEIEELYKFKGLARIYGICCNMSNVFMADINGSVRSYALGALTTYSVTGEVAKREIIHKRRGFEPDSGNFFSHDHSRDLLYYVFPKSKCIGTIDGTSHVEIEFGNKKEEFSIGKSSDLCSFSNPVSIAATRNGRILVADKDSHSVFMFKSDVKQHPFVDIFGTPMTPGNKDGDLSKASFTSPTALLSLGKNIMVADNDGTRIRLIDMGKLTINTLCETGSKIICLTTDFEKNPCWIEEG